MKCMTIEDVKNLVGTVNSEPVFGHSPERLLCIGVDIKLQKPCPCCNIVLRCQVTGGAYLRLLEPNKHWFTKWFKTKIVKKLPIYPAVKWNLPFRLATVRIADNAIEFEIRDLIILAD